jgi:hypothetical protein
MNQVWIYDIEIFKTYFGVTFKNVKTKEIKLFEIFQNDNDLRKLIDFINNNKLWLAGYNNYHFDNQILNYLLIAQPMLESLEADLLCFKIFEMSTSIIKDNNNAYKYSLPFNSIDLMQVGNTQNKSLKLVAVNIKHDLIQDLPIPWNMSVYAEDIEMIRLYNLNDVIITEKLYNILLPAIKMRFMASRKYKLDLMNETDSGMSNRIIEEYYYQITNIPKWTFKEFKTIRDSVAFKDVIFDYIEFNSPELQSLLIELKNFTYTEDNKFEKSIILQGVKYQLGVGGLHTADRPELFEETTELMMIDFDIGSFYPSLIINNHLCPEHLSSELIVKYKQIRDDRLTAKHRGDISESDILKLVINAFFGKTGDKNHWLFDMLVMLRTTVNGQLVILSLIELFIKHKWKVFSANTDGVTCIVPRSEQALFESVCLDFCKSLNFEGEFSYYKKYIKRDVNNYLIHTTSAKKPYKLKGIFEPVKALNKGFDKPIVPIALFEYFINNKSIRETIPNHKDIYDFCIAKKIDDKFTNKLIMTNKDGVEIVNLQKTIRFYVSKKGGHLYKKDKATGKLINYVVGRTVAVLNEFDNSVDYFDNIEYGYYISETQKIIDTIVNPQLKLF